MLLPKVVALPLPFQVLLLLLVLTFVVACIGIVLLVSLAKDDQGSPPINGSSFLLITYIFVIHAFTENNSSLNSFS